MFAFINLLVALAVIFANAKNLKTTLQIDTMNMLQPS